MFGEYIVTVLTENHENKFHKNLCECRELQKEIFCKILQW